MGVCVPEEYGGAGADFLSYVLVLEELSRADAGVGVTVAVHTSAATLPIVALRQRGAEAAVRAGARAGRDARRLRAHGARRGLGRGLAAHGRRARRRRVADHRLEAVDHERRPRRHDPRSSRARTPRPQGARGVSAFLLAPEHVTVTRVEEKLGLNSSSTVDLSSTARTSAATGCCTRSGRVSRSRWPRSTAAGSGSPPRPSGSRRPRTTLRAVYALERRQFGRRIADFQAIQFKLADMATADRRRPPAHVPRGLAEAGGPAAHGRGREGEALRLRDGAPADGRGDPDPRRLRLHEGVPGRALLPRREDHRDLRGHERGAADGDRPQRSSSTRSAQLAPA